VDLFPGLLGNVLERLLQKRMLDDDFCFPNMSWPVLISLETHGAKHVEDQQAGVGV
jgi:hypothetical protein